MASGGPTDSEVPLQPAAPGGEEFLVWPPPLEELDGVEFVPLETAPGPGTSSLGRLADREVPSPAQRDRAVAGSAALDTEPPASDTASRWEPVMASAGDSESAEARPSGRPDPGKGEDQPAGGLTVSAPAAWWTAWWNPGVHRARRSVPWWAVPAILLGGGVGLAGGWLIRPALVSTPHTVKVTVETTPPGADVVVDGTPRGKAPLQLELPPGARRLAVTAGGVTREALLSLTLGTDVVRVFDFGPAPGAPTDVDRLSGSLEVQTRPPGAQVVIAGQARGVTPLTVTGLAPGILDVQLVTAERTLTQQVEVRAGRQAMLVVPMTGSTAAEPGWVAVLLPVPLRILEGGRVVGTTDSDRIMLSGGRHNLELVNDQLEVRLARSVVVQGGRELPLDVSLPRGMVSINAKPWAEVFVEGNRLGETPLGNVSLPVGEHEVVFRHPQLGERRQAVTVRAATPARVSVAFTP